MPNPFQGPDFKELLTKWNERLKLEGLKELNDFHGSQWQTHGKDNHRPTLDQIRDKQRYYDLAKQVLQTFLFRTTLHRRMWELHCKGFSYRKIANIMRAKKFRKSMIHLKIKQIEQESGLKYG